MDFTQGGFELDGLAELAREDSVRLQRQAQKKQQTRQKRGHKGTRTWGYDRAGSGKRRRKS